MAAASDRQVAAINCGCRKAAFGLSCHSSSTRLYMVLRIKGGLRRNAQSSSAAFRAAEGVSVSSVVTSSTESFEEPRCFTQRRREAKNAEDFQLSVFAVFDANRTKAMRGENQFYPCSLRVKNLWDGSDFAARNVTIGCVRNRCRPLRLSRATPCRRRFPSPPCRSNRLTTSGRVALRRDRHLEGVPPVPWTVHVRPMQRTGRPLSQ